VLYREFGWEIFKSLGGDPRQKSRYRWQQILITLLKLDWFFFVGFTVQVRSNPVSLTSSQALS
jgi:hypothetical protein